MNKIDFGVFGEEIAAQYLERKGYKIVHKNFKCRLGEIDIIAEKGAEIIFVEVKTRSNIRFGVPSESVGKTKVAKIRRAAAVYLLANKCQNSKIRFDVIEIVLNQIKNAF